MAATDGQIIVAAARWAEDASYLREFVSKYRLPTVIKITKGQYGGLGVPTLPAPSLQSTALLLSAGRRRKIIAQAVELKKGRRVVGVGPKILIPDTFPGYFEILSEEGRAVRGIESVNELSRNCPEEGALVRESIRGIACKIQDETGAILAEGSKTIATGETVSVVGQVSLPGRGKFLQCIDSHGDGVLISMEQRCRFSALARQDEIGGVHTAKALLSKRFPLSVRLVHGQPPRGLKSCLHFLSELRLLSSIEEEDVFALPLQREIGGVVALPLAAPLKLVKSKNEDVLEMMPELTRLVDRATRLLAHVADEAQVLDGRVGDEKKSSTRQSRRNNFMSKSINCDHTNNHNHRQLHHYHHNNHNHHHHNHQHHHHQLQQTKNHGLATYYRDENRLPVSQCNTREYDEIDQIYDYVRGFAPLPKSVSPHNKSPICHSCTSVPIDNGTSSPSHPNTPGFDGPSFATSLAPLQAAPSPDSTSISAPELVSNQVTVPLPSQLITDDPPEPPPIETIPTKKNHAEKRTRQTVEKAPMPRMEKPPLAKLYIKNSGTQRAGRPQLPKQKSSSLLKETLPNFKSGSPLFNIRYKSLTNLQQAMEHDGTLDSSHSGGQTSGDSGAGAKFPEKRSRRLGRPRSLTNLVWQLGNGDGVKCTRPETLSSTNNAPLIPSSKCGQRLAVTVISPRRIGTLYL